VTLPDGLACEGDGENHMQMAADPFQGVPSEALAEFPLAWIERVREGKFWFPD
jgi:hypothetical protein